MRGNQVYWCTRMVAVSPVRLLIGQPQAPPSSASHAIGLDLETSVTKLEAVPGVQSIGQYKLQNAHLWPPFNEADSRQVPIALMVEGDHTENETAGF